MSDSDDLTGILDTLGTLDRDATGREDSAPVPMEVVALDPKVYWLVSAPVATAAEASLLIAELANLDGVTVTAGSP